MSSNVGCESESLIRTVVSHPSDSLICQGTRVQPTGCWLRWYTSCRRCLHLRIVEWCLITSTPLPAVASVTAGAAEHGKNTCQSCYNARSYATGSHTRLSSCKREAARAGGSKLLDIHTCRNMVLETQARDDEQIWCSFVSLPCFV